MTATVTGHPAVPDPALSDPATGGPATSGPAAQAWRRWRAPLAIVAVIIVGGIVVALLQPPAGTTGYLDPGNPQPDGARALATLLAERGSAVTRVSTVSAAAAAATPGASSGPSPGRQGAGHTADHRSRTTDHQPAEVAGPGASRPGHRRTGPGSAGRAGPGRHRRAPGARAAPPAAVRPARRAPGRLRRAGRGGAAHYGPGRRAVLPGQRAPVAGPLLRRPPGHHRARHQRTAHKLQPGSARQRRAEPEPARRKLPDHLAGADAARPRRSPERAAGVHQHRSVRCLSGGHPVGDRGDPRGAVARAAAGAGRRGTSARGGARRGNR